ncbi:MAG: ribonuclease HI family protein [Patescibacteria group bacterium]
MKKPIRIFTDGGARGNPGPAGSGAYLLWLDEDGKVTSVAGEVSEYIGETTNNQAEYKAIVFGLQKARELGATHVDLVMDSELAMKQLNGQYKVKNAELAKRFHEVCELKHYFKKVTFRHVRRELNKHADALVNKAIDSKSLSVF